MGLAMVPHMIQRTLRHRWFSLSYSMVMPENGQDRLLPLNSEIQFGTNLGGNLAVSWQCSRFSDVVAIHMAEDDVLGY